MLLEGIYIGVGEARVLETFNGAGGVEGSVMSLEREPWRVWRASTVGSVVEDGVGDEVVVDAGKGEKLPGALGCAGLEDCIVGCLCGGL